MIYLDNAATTKVDLSLKSLIDTYLYSQYGNSNSKHVAGKQPGLEVEYARSVAASFFNGEKENVIFTSGGSEANTMAIVGLAPYLESIGKKHLITTKYEHHSVLNSMKEMERRGFEVTYLDVPGGVVDLERLKKEIRRDTGFASIMFVNNEIGTINDVHTIYKVCKERGVIFHSDCVQAAGTFPLNNGDIADLLSISGHKFHAPKGIGCLYSKVRDKMTGIIFGGEQEQGQRGGTENVAYIAAMEGAMLNVMEDMTKNNDKVSELKKLFLNLLSQKDFGGNVYSFSIKDHETVDKIISMRFKDVDAESLIYALSDRGVCVSAGSACSSHEVEPSHVLKAIGLSDEDAYSTIRISFSDMTTEEEVRQFTDILAECVNQIKLASTVVE